jgi:hypothetical protein
LFLLLVLLAFAIFFHRAAEFEDESSLIWSGLSLVISVVTMFWLGWGWLGIICGQGGLFVGITLFRMRKK